MLSSLSSSHLASLVMTLLIGIAVIALRLRAANKPTSMKKIIIPPLGMSTGFVMFIMPAARIPWSWGLAAFAGGAVLFAYPLIRTSALLRIGDQVYLKRSKMFIFIIVALLLIRLLLHDVVEQYVNLIQSGAIFYLLAFGMILPWRLAMLRDFLKLKQK
jgi:membrane protein CcdC involved in cytochrome C biogenesis